MLYETVLGRAFLRRLQMRCTTSFCLQPIRM